MDWLKRCYIKISQYFPKYFPIFFYEPFGGEINVKKNLCNYVTETNLKNTTGFDISSFSTDLRSLKSNVDKLNIDKLKNISIGLSNLTSRVDKLSIGKLTPVKN